MKTLLALTLVSCGGLALAGAFVPDVLRTVQDQATQFSARYDKLLFPETTATPSHAHEELPEGARIWRDDTGRTCVATFVGLRDGMVRLQRIDGRFGDWPLHRLSRRDREFVARNAKQ